MNKTFNGLLSIVSLSLLLTGCTENSSVKQISEELVYGEEYKVDDLFSATEDGVTFSVEDSTIKPDSLGDYELLLTINDGKTTTEETFSFNVIDQTPPEIVQMKDQLVIGEDFSLDSLFYAKDDVDKGLDISTNVEFNDINNQKLGVYTIRVSATDKSNNTSVQEMSIQVVDDKTLLNKGDVITSNFGSNEIQLTLKSVDFQDEVKSFSDNMFASYFADVAGEKYIVVKTNIKNLGGNSISNYDIENYNESTLYVTFDNKYNYALQQLDTTSCVMSEFWSLEPLKSQDVYFVNTVPDELSKKSYTVYFTLGDTDYYIEG